MKRRKKKKGASPLLWSFVLTLLVIAIIGAVWWFSQTPEPQDPEPVGTPNRAPVVDQRPVPAVSAPQPAASVPAPAPGSPATEQGCAEPSASVSSQPAASSAPETPAQGVDALGGEQVVRGVIVDATTSSVTIQTADGTQLSFMRETADVTGRLVEEAEAEVYYVGSISGSDTSAAFVTRIVSFA